MGLISKPYTFADGGTIEAAEHNSNFDTVYAAVNGGLDEDNLSGSTQIPNAYLVEIAPTKVGDHAADDSDYSTGATPGTSASLSRPSTLSGELERIRYRFAANNGLLFASYMDSGGAPQSIVWVEPPIRYGLQFLPNNGFEVKTSVTATDAPDGWSLYGTPTDLTVTTHASSGDSFGVDKRFLHITGDSAEGIQVVVGGLKPSTKYIIGMNYVRTSGTVAMSTTGALGSGAYQNLSLTFASGTSASTAQGVVSSNASGGDITVRFHCGASSTEFALYQVWMFELTERSGFVAPHIPVQTAQITTATSGLTGWTGTGNAWRTDTLSDLSLSQYIPSEGYRIVYEVSVPFRSADATNEGIQARGEIQLNTGGGANTVEGPVFYELDNAGSNAQCGGTFFMRYALDNPEPGTTYAFTFKIGGWDEADLADIIVAPLVNTLQTAATSRLIVERI